MAGKVTEIVKAYLKAFGSGDTGAYRNLLSEDAEAHYSSLGEYHGMEEIIANVHIPEVFDDYTVTMLNTLSYSEGKTVTVSTIAQHLNYYEDTPYLYPVVYGGQYVFKIDAGTGKITEIFFRMDYQGENTWYLHDWTLADGHDEGEMIRKVFSCDQAYEAIMGEEYTDAEKAENLARLYLTAWNIRDIDFLKKITREGTVFTREKTYSNGKLCGTIEEVQQYIHEVADYYDLNEWGARINGTSAEDGKITVEFQLLSPYRLGTKKMNASNKFSSFYDEAGTIVFDASWKVTGFDLVKMAEIYMNGFDVIEA